MAAWQAWRRRAEALFWGGQACAPLFFVMSLSGMLVLLVEAQCP